MSNDLRGFILMLSVIIFLALSLASGSNILVITGLAVMVISLVKMHRIMFK